MNNHSLRKHRPSAGMPRQSMIPSMSALVPETIGETPRARGQDKEVSNVMKKRYSTKPKSKQSSYAHQAGQQRPAMPTDNLQYSAPSIVEEEHEDQIDENYKNPYASMNTSTVSRSDATRSEKFTAQIAPTSSILQDQQLQIFSDPGFKAEDFLSQNLANISPEGIIDFEKVLAKHRLTVSKGIQASVLQNYTNFVVVSKEFSRLTQEVAALRLLLANFSSAASSIKEEAEQRSHEFSNESNQLNGRRTNRNSVLQLENLWASKLASLWRHVEGAQKYVPARPGRHIVAESGGWFELNPMSLKKQRPVHIILLNDNILIAVKRGRRGHTESQSSVQGFESTRETPIDGDNYDRAKQFSYTKGQPVLVAELCWPLRDVELVDVKKHKIVPLKDADDVICLRKQGQIFLYKTEKPDHYQSLKAAFKSVYDDFNKEKKNKVDERYMVRDSIAYLASRDPSLWNHKDLLSNLSSKMSNEKESSLSNFHYTEKVQQLEDQLHTLDVKIARRNFEDAIVHLESSKQEINQRFSSDSLTHSFFTYKFDSRADNLTDLLLSHFDLDFMSLKEVRQHMTWLIRLNRAEQAREKYLSSRTTLIRKRIRQITFQGEIPSYISQIALATFTLVRNTADVFSTCFPDGKHISMMVAWVKSEIEAFTLLFSRQLYAIPRASNSFKACVAVSHKHAEILKSAGLNMSSILDQSLS